MFTYIPNKVSMNLVTVTTDLTVETKSLRVVAVNPRVAKAVQKAAYNPIPTIHQGPGALTMCTKMTALSTRGLVRMPTWDLL